MTRSFRAYCAAAIIAASVSPAIVMAQATPAAQPPAQMQSTVNPTDAQLKKFATASQKVAVVADEYRPKLQAAKDEPAREKVYREADEQMVKVVQADGLTVDEFNGIGQAIEQDPQLRKRVIEMVDPGAREGATTPR